MAKPDEIAKLHIPKPKKKILDVIAKRWSPRSFSDEKVPQEDIDCMIEAARWAPSGRNFEPWYFYYTQKPSPTYDKLFETLGSNNKDWANSAPLLIACCMDKSADSTYDNYDLGAAVFSLVLQAQELGFYCRQMAMFDKEKAGELLNKDHEPYVILAIGKLGDYENVHEVVMENELIPRPRKEKISEELK